MSKCVWLVTWGLWLAFAALPIQAQSAWPVEEFWQRIEATRALTDELSDAAPETRRARLNAAADEWAALREVTFANGTRLPVNAAPLAAALRADPPDLPRVRAQLNVLRELKATWPLGRHSAADLDALRALLSRPEFQWQTRQPWFFEQWLNDLRAAIDRWLRQLFSGFGDEVRVPVFGDVLTVVAVLALLLVLLYVARGLRSGFSADAAANAVHDEALLTAEAALTRAQTLSAGGDYRTAVRYLYLGALLWLDERGLLRYDRSATNREYLRRVADKPELAGTLRAVVEVFDRVWYGYEPVDAATYAIYEQHVAELRRLA